MFPLKMKPKDQSPQIKYLSGDGFREDHFFVTTCESLILICFLISHK